MRGSVGFKSRALATTENETANERETPRDMYIGTLALGGIRLNQSFCEDPRRRGRTGEAGVRDTATMGGLGGGGELSWTAATSLYQRWYYRLRGMAARAGGCKEAAHEAAGRHLEKEAGAAGEEHEGREGENHHARERLLVLLPQLPPDH